MADHIRPLSDISLADREAFGRYFGHLGEMFANKTLGAGVPAGFVISKEMYEQFFEHNKLKNTFKQLLARVDLYDYRSLEKTSAALRRLIVKGAFPEVVKKSVHREYLKLSGQSVVVRTSVVADEDLEVAALRKRNFKITSEAVLLTVLKKIMADHFDEATLIAVLSKGYDYRSLPLAWLVQTEVVAPLSGEVVCDNDRTLSVRARTGFQGGEYCETAIVSIAGVKQQLPAIIRREGSGAWLLSEKIILQIAEISVAQRATLAYHRITFVVDKAGVVHVTGFEVCGERVGAVARTFVLQKKGVELVRGRAVGQAIAQGKLVFAATLEKALASLAGNVLVVGETDARWDSALGKASAVVTDVEGLESHTARVCREHGVPCLVGVRKIKHIGKEHDVVTVSCADGPVGAVYKGALPFMVEALPEGVPMKTKLTVTVTDTAQAEALSCLPFAGVGLLPEETMYAKYVGIHPLALTTKKFLPKAVKVALEHFAGHEKPADAAVRRMAEEIARAAVAFEGREVVFRLSAADTAQYSQLIGGSLFEKVEKNPMLGWRGVARFIDPKFAPAFELTCQAVKRVRDSWGLKNVSLLIPFCRTLEEGQQIVALLKKYGLERGVNGLKVYVMCEIPANALLAKEFAQLFDGFSIGLNQLAELTLGLDHTVFSDHAHREEDRAIKTLITEVIKVAHRAGKTISMCDATPSEYPQFVSFLVQQGVDSIAVTPDRARIVEAEVVRTERKMAKTPLTLPFMLATRAASVAGFTGMSMLLAGYSCQPVNIDETKQQLKLAMEQQVADIKADLENKLAKERAGDIAARVDHYHERGFADFSLTYPSSWTFTTQANGVEFRAPSGTPGYFDVYREPRKAMKEYPFTATSTWLGSDVGSYVEGDAKVVVIFPNDKAFKETVVIEGTAADFDKIFNTIIKFSWIPKLK